MAVIIGMDPHKRSATIEVIDDRGQVVAAGKYGTDKTGYAEMVKAGRRFPERVWAVEGCNGIGLDGVARDAAANGGGQPQQILFEVPGWPTIEERGHLDAGRWPPPGGAYRGAPAEGDAGRRCRALGTKYQLLPRSRWRLSSAVPPPGRPATP